MMTVAVAFGASAAMAQEDYVEPTQGGYATVLGGLTAHDQREAILNGTTVTPKFKDGWAALVSGGYKWEGGLRTELELGFRRNTAKDVDTSATPAFGSQHDISIMGNVLYDINTNSRFTPFVGVGVGVSMLEWDHVRTATSPIFNARSSKFAWQGIAGVAVAMSPNLQFLMEARLKSSSNHAYPGSTTNVKLTDYDNRSYEALVGLRYTWGEVAKKQEPAPPPPPPPAPVAKPAPPPVPQKFLVFFDFDRATLRSDARKIITEGVAYAKNNSKTVLNVTGHTDTSGTAAYNMGLSERRAEAVKAELIRQGVPASEISVRWKGESEPLVQTGDGVKEPQNRRVEIVLE
jgi:outer membrane protein OmpA-like peptidoglycan-associated protein